MLLWNARYNFSSQVVKSLRANMSWNPLRKTHLTQRPSIASPAVTEDNDRELNMLFHGLHGMEESTRRLQKGMKRYLEAISAAQKAELKLSLDLSSSTVCHEDDNLRNLAEVYHSFNVRVSEKVGELVNKSQFTFVDPLKKLGAEFSGLANALQTHEQAVLEWRKAESQVRKLEERKDRTASAIAKLEKEKRALASVAENVASSHAQLRHEMRTVYNMRIPYIQPCLQALTHIQFDHHGSATQCFTHLTPTPKPSSSTGTKEKEEQTHPVFPVLIPEAEYRCELQRKFASIQALSIVKANKP